METASKDILRQKHYQIYRDIRLGRGTFGKVYKGYDENNKRRVAVKEIDNASMEFAQREVEILSHLREHDNVVRIFDSFIYTNSVWVVMQFCDGRTLAEYMQQTNPGFDARQSIAEQFAEAMSYMSSVSPPTAHRDLKPDNILIVNGRQVITTI